MPGSAGVSTAAWRRWALKIDEIVTDDGATIDFFNPLEEDDREEVTDDDVVRLLTPAVQSVNVVDCCLLTDASIAAVVAQCPHLSRLKLESCTSLSNASIIAVAKNCRHLEVLDVAWCDSLTDASIVAIAEKCTNLVELEVCGCLSLTDASITAVAENCKNLAELDVSRCSSLTDASITAIAENCANLTTLDVGYCNKLTNASIEAVAENCTNLAQLDVCGCRLTVLPENIGNLSKLRRLDADDNLFKELPPSIVDLDASCILDVYGNESLRTPPYEIATKGLAAIKRYFEELDD